MHEKKIKIYLYLYRSHRWQTVSSITPKMSLRHLLKTAKTSLSRGTYNHRKSVLDSQLTVLALNITFYKGKLHPTVCRGCREQSPTATATHRAQSPPAFHSLYVQSVQALTHASLLTQRYIMLAWVLQTQP